MKLALKNFRIVDEETDMIAGVMIEDGIIKEVSPGRAYCPGENTAVVIDGLSLVPEKLHGLPVLMPAFVDLHAHFRDPGENLGPDGPPAEIPSEVLESASLSAAAGGFGTVVCMANTRPAIDTVERAAAIRKRSGVLGLVDLYPVLSLTKNLEGKELSEITAVSGGSAYIPLMFSEDGRDIADDDLFLRAMKEAKRTGIPVSCHCDFGGEEAGAAKKAGQPRDVWSKIEEINAVRRVIELGEKADCHIHIAHVSTREAVETIRRVKAELAEVRKNAACKTGFTLTCEAMPHNFCLTEEDAARLGDESWGRVNPPLRPEHDRKAVTQAVADGTVDAIATDHAPHRDADKRAGAAGFSGFETAFAAAYTELVRPNIIGLKYLSSLMSARPARLLGFGGKRGHILPGCRADLVVINTEEPWKVDASAFKTRGKNSPFEGRQLFGKIIMTFHKGRLVYQE